MSGIRKLLLYSLGEKRYLRLLASSFQKLFQTGHLGVDYQDIYFLKSLVRQSDYCIDIGAHLGYFTLELSRLVGNSGRVYAIEPMSKFFNTLHDLVVSRKLENIVLYQYAMGGNSDFVEMGIPELNKIKKFAYARAISSHTSLHYLETEKVKNAFGDELFRSLPHVDFIKCDVEGLELAVIRSFLEVIAKHRPILLCELGDPIERDKMQDLLSPLSYGLYYLENKKLRPLKKDRAVSPVSHNHYFIPENRLLGQSHLLSS